MSRIDQLVRAARAARSYKLVRVDGRDAVQIATADGTQTSFLTAGEAAELLAAIDAPPATLQVAGLPELVWSEHRASGRDDAAAVDVTIEASRAQVMPEDGPRMAAAYARAIAQRAAITRDVAARMQRLYNDTWRDGPRLSAAQLAERLRLDTIVLSPCGPPTLWFGDGDLFAGHSIEVTIDDAGVITWCELAG